MAKRKVLVLFANPRGTTPLRLGLEERTIHDCVRHSDAVEVISRQAATFDGLRQELLQHRPEILQISAHGSEKGLSLEERAGYEHCVDPEALTELIALSQPPVRAVVLNACYSATHADEFERFNVPCLIAMSTEISEAGAIEFTRGFYDALAAGENVESAFHHGRNSMKARGHDAGVVELHKREGTIEAPLYRDKFDGREGVVFDWWPRPAFDSPAIPMTFDEGGDCMVGERMQHQGDCIARYVLPCASRRYALKVETGSKNTWVRIDRSIRRRDAATRSDVPGKRMALAERLSDVDRVTVTVFLASPASQLFQVVLNVAELQGPQFRETYDRRKQELTIFDLNDFVDPRDLGAVPTSRGRFTCPCVDSLVTRAMLGWDHDFVNVMQPTSLDVAFAHVATSYYRAPFQFNVKASVVREVHRPRVAFVGRLAMPRESLTLQLAHYKASGNGANAVVGRVQATWRIARYTIPGRIPESDLSPVTPARTFERELIHHEFGAELDLNLFRKFLGSLSFTAIGGEQLDADSLAEVSRLAYVQRFPAFELGRVRVEPTITAGLLGRQLEFGGLNAVALQPSLRAALPIGSKGVHLNARFAPTYQRHAVRSEREGPVRREWLERYELAIFLDAPVFTKTWFREPRQSQDE